MNQRLFSDEELREMEKRTLDRLTSAIDEGDADKARRIAQRMYNEFLSMHDLYRNWVAATLSEIGRRYGDEVLEEIVTEGTRAWWQPTSDRFSTDPQATKKNIKMFVAGLHGHLQPLGIKEDDDKVEIQLQPCGSGGRLVSEGKYEGAKGWLKIEKPQRLTYGREDFPVYCAHESAMERVDIQNRGKPFVVVEPAAEIGKGYCTMIVYKDPDKIPAKYYERLGLKKPA